MESASVTVTDKDGLHLRVAGAIARAVQSYDARVLLSCNGCRMVEGNSVMQLLVLGAPQGARVVITAEGPDERAAVQAVSDILIHGAGI